MIQDIWHSFPNTLESKINGLLHIAEPSNAKCFQLYKSCQTEELWKDNFEKFSERISSFFAIPANRRKKSDLDRILSRPAPSYLFKSFHLDFGNALIDNYALSEIASWAHHLMRVRLKKSTSGISQKTLHASLYKLTHPQPHEKVHSVNFADFCSTWRKTVRFLFGEHEEQTTIPIITELQEIYELQKTRENEISAGTSFIPTLYLTQTEINWVTGIIEAIHTETAVPHFPLARGPEKQRLCELHRTLQLYRIVQTTRLPELLEHKSKIRLTLLSQCQKILNDCAR